jgi:hypothetical protein
VVAPGGQGQQGRQGGAASVGADFNDRGRQFQADRGQRFNAIMDALGLRASEVVNVSQSSTISLNRGADGLLSMRL